MSNDNIRGRHRAPGRHNPLNELKLLARESAQPAMKGAARRRRHRWTRRQLRRLGERRDRVRPTRATSPPPRADTAASRRRRPAVTAAPAAASTALATIGFAPAQRPPPRPPRRRRSRASSRTSRSRPSAQPRSPPPRPPPQLPPRKVAVQRVSRDLTRRSLTSSTSARKSTTNTVSPSASVGRPRLAQLGHPRSVHVGRPHQVVPVRGLLPRWLDRQRDGRGTAAQPRPATP